MKPKTIILTVLILFGLVVVLTWYSFYCGCKKGYTQGFGMGEYYMMQKIYKDWDAQRR